MKLALAQTNPTVGNLVANTDRIIEYAQRAAASGAGLVIFPELAISGYPPFDLIKTSGYLDANDAELRRLAKATAGLDIGLAVGYCGPSEERDRAANCVACLHRGRIVMRQAKVLLPTYDVFDETRYFAPGGAPGIWNCNGLRIGLTICEDAWNDKQFWERSRYSRDPVEELVERGIDLLVNLSASPYHMGKRGLRLAMFQAAATRHGVPTAFVNQVGGNDQLVFDGSSFALNAKGEIRAQAASFHEDLAVWSIDSERPFHELDWTESDPSNEVEAVYEALVLGVRDYVSKCGFQTALVGLSGGIDSALTVTLAAEALGSANVLGVAMPGPYSSEGSLSDARSTAHALGIRFRVISIDSPFSASLEQLAPLFAGTRPNVAEENLQARLRGNTLMAISNKFNGLVLTTGNKSELAVGYCTLYGDMCGGLAVISDVPKTLAYKLAKVANRRHPGAIPDSVMTKPPSAELRPNQKDTDSLPPYEVLDPILRLYVEEDLSVAAIADRLEQPARLIRKIAKMVDRNEYKRQQAAPGLRVTSKAFGLGRRIPIAHQFVR